MNIRTLLISFLIYNSVQAQDTLFYADLYLEPDIVAGGSYQGWQSYSLEGMVIYNGLGRNDLHMKVLSKSGDNEILDFEENEGKAKRYNLRFYKADEDLPIMMMVDLAGQYSWGNYVFWIENGTISKCGFIPYGADNFNFSSIGLYAEFSYNDGQIILEFRDDISLIDYEKDKLFPASEIKYFVTKDVLTRIR